MAATEIARQAVSELLASGRCFATIVVVKLNDKMKNDSNDLSCFSWFIEEEPLIWYFL